MILKELSPELPIVHVTAVRRAERQTVGFYICPVYFTTARGAANLITKFDIAMESEDSDDKNWILSGVALFLAPEWADWICYALSGTWLFTDEAESVWLYEKLSWFLWATFNYAYQ